MLFENIYNGKIKHGRLLQLISLLNQIHLAKKISLQAIQILFPQSVVGPDQLCTVYNLVTFIHVGQHTIVGLYGHFSWARVNVLSELVRLGVFAAI